MGGEVSMSGAQCGVVMSRGDPSSGWLGWDLAFVLSSSRLPKCRAAIPSATGNQWLMAGSLLSHQGPSPPCLLEGKCLSLELPRMEVLGDPLFDMSPLSHWHLSLLSWVM